MHEGRRITKTKAILVVIRLFPIALIGWLGWNYFVPGGVYFVHYEVLRPAPQVVRFSANESETVLASPADKNQQRVTQVLSETPVQIDLALPRSFDDASVTLTYQNPDQQPIIRLGAQRPNGTYTYFDLAHDDPTLESLPDEWERVTQGNLVLWQKNKAYEQKKNALIAQHKPARDALQQELTRRLSVLERQYKRGAMEEFKYQSERQVIRDDIAKRTAAIDAASQVTDRPAPRFSSVKDFLAALPPTTSTLQYNYNLAQHVRLPKYQPSTVVRTIDTSLRGSHELYTYLGEGESLDFEFTVQSLNREAGMGRVVADVWDLSQSVVKLATDRLGTGAADGVPSAATQLHVRRAHLPAGVYRIILTLPDDIVISKIRTTAQKLVFRNGLYIAENNEYASVLGEGPFAPTRMVTSSTRVSALTEHASSFQTITVGSSTLALQQINTARIVTGLQGLTTVTTSVNDIKLQGNGYFAFSEEEFFPVPVRYLDFSPNRNLRRYDYIFGSYPQSAVDGEWLVASATIHNLGLYLHDNTLSLALVFPGLNESGREVRIKKIDFRLTKPPITWQTIIPKIESFIQRAL